MQLRQRPRCFQHTMHAPHIGAGRRDMLERRAAGMRPTISCAGCIGQRMWSTLRLRRCQRAYGLARLLAHDVKHHGDACRIFNRIQQQTSWSRAAFQGRWCTSSWHADEQARAQWDSHSANSIQPSSVQPCLYTAYMNSFNIQTLKK